MKYLRFQQITLFIKPSLVFMALLCMSTFTVSCTATFNNNSANSNSANGIQPKSESKNVEPLRVAIIPWHSQEAQQNKLEPLADYFEKSIQRPVKFEITKDYDSAINLLATEKADIGYLGPLAYIKCNEKNPHIQPLVKLIDEKTGRPWYTSVIVGNRERGIKSLKDLKGKSFAFVSPSSASGFLIPMMGLKKNGIEPTRDFLAIRYSQSHDKSEKMLMKGEVDAIADDKTSFLRSLQNHQADSQKYQILWESDPIPMTTLVINTKKFSAQELNKIRQALIDAPVGILDVSGSTSAGYTLAKDADFEPVRQIYKQFKSLEIPPK